VRHRTTSHTHTGHTTNCCTYTSPQPHKTWTHGTVARLGLLQQAAKHQPMLHTIKSLAPIHMYPHMSLVCRSLGLSTHCPIPFNCVQTVCVSCMRVHAVSEQPRGCLHHRPFKATHAMQHITSPVVHHRPLGAGPWGPTVNPGLRAAMASFTCRIRSIGRRRSEGTPSMGLPCTGVTRTPAVVPLGVRLGLPK
jgi:hypothetical protein